MLLILCVDGLCPEIAEKRGYPRLPYQRKITIPPELYYEGMPHTLLVWPSIFHGISVDINLKETINKIYSKDNWNFRLRQALIKIGMKKFLNVLKFDYKKHLSPTEKQYHIQPYMHNIDTVFDHHSSATWNIPGINPECVVGFPTLESFLPYIKRQYQNWKNLTFGMAVQPQKINAAYTNILDGLSHRKQPTDPFYLDLQNHIDMLQKITDIDIMLVSDHGCTPDGDHTDYAYLGCTSPLTATKITDIRFDIERILGSTISKEAIYWETRYKKGGNSGKGSIGNHREWKWNIINRYIQPPLSVIDVGCGDLTFWQNNPPSDYIGIDISKTIIEQNRKKKPTAHFIKGPAEKTILKIKAPIVLCLDVLFHIMDDDAYTQILYNLCEYSTDLIFIYTWTKNPLNNKETDGIYQKYRTFKNYLEIFNDRGFELIEKASRPIDPGAMYILQKTLKSTTKKNMSLLDTKQAEAPITTHATN